MKILLQIALVFALCLVCNAISSILPFIMPGSVLAMIVLFFLLFFRVLKVRHIREKADFMQQVMAFFFIPPGLALMEHLELLGEIIVPLVVINIVSAFICFAVTGWTVQAVIKLQNYVRGKKTSKGGV